jgi:uncharacterized protein YbaA (DUF1428 family)
MPYVDGFIVPVAREKLEDYRRIAEICGKIWMEHGATAFRENLAEDVKPGKYTSFPQSVDLKEDEVVVFSWIEFASREERDRVNGLVMEDPRMQEFMKVENMPFDGKRMIYGGFTSLVQL